MKNLVKILDWSVKVASLSVTGPATWRIAGQLFDYITDPFWKGVVQIFALILVEGVLLSNWILLQFDRDALPEIKARYGLTALAMYIAVLVIAWADEGPLGLVFRLALLLALVGSGWDTYVATWNSIARKTDKGIENNPRVRREIRKLSKDLAIQKANADHVIQTKMLAVQVDTQSKRIELAGQRDATLADQLHQQEVKALSESVNSVNFTDGLQSLQSIQVQPVESVLLISSKPEPDDLDMKVVDLYRQYPGLSYRKAAEMLGVSHTMVAKMVKDLEVFGLLYKEDGKVYPVEAPALPAGNEEVPEQTIEEPTLVDVPPTADPQPDEPSSRFQNATNTGEF